MRSIGLYFNLISVFFGLWLSAKEADTQILTPPSPLRVLNIAKKADVPAAKPPLVTLKSFIIIDPGHGGHDVGTQSVSKPRYQEKTLNLTTAKFVKNYLQEMGYRVVLTREEDKFISLERRAKMANEQKPSIFVSIHYNSAPSAEAQGVEVFYYQTLDDKIRSNKSKKMAQIILQSILKQTAAKSRGVKHGNFAVIRETNMPAVLIEGGFLTNEKEMQKLKEAAYLEKMARGIANGIDNYLKSGSS